MRFLMVLLEPIMEDLQHLMQIRRPYFENINIEDTFFCECI